MKKKDKDWVEYKIAYHEQSFKPHDILMAKLKHLDQRFDNQGILIGMIVDYLGLEFKYTPEMQALVKKGDER